MRSTLSASVECYFYGSPLETHWFAIVYYCFQSVIISARDRESIGNNDTGANNTEGEGNNFYMPISLIYATDIHHLFYNCSDPCPLRKLSLSHSGLVHQMLSDLQPESIIYLRPFSSFMQYVISKKSCINHFFFFHIIATLCRSRTAPWPSRLSRAT